MRIMLSSDAARIITVCFEVDTKDGSAMCEQTVELCYVKPASANSS